METIITEATETADLVYSKYKKNTLIDPIKYRCDVLLMEIITNEGIGLYPYPFSGDFCGMLLMDELEDSICYNSNMQKERRNFTIGHELGHYFLHQDLETEFADRNKDMLDNSVKEFEIQANTFSAYLVLPTEILSYMLSHKFTFYRIAKTVQISYECLYWRIVNYLSDQYGLTSSQSRLFVDEYKDFSEGRKNNLTHHGNAQIFYLNRFNCHDRYRRLKSGDVPIKMVKDKLGNVVSITNTLYGNY